MESDHSLQVIAIASALTQSSSEVDKANGGSRTMGEAAISVVDAMGIVTDRLEVEGVDGGQRLCSGITSLPCRAARGVQRGVGSSCYAR